MRLPHPQWIARATLIVAVCFPFAACRAQAPKVIERDEWASVQYGEHKIGYAHFTSGVEADGERAGLARMGIEVTLRLSEMGLPVEIEVTITQWIDPKTRRPVRIEAYLPAGDQPTHKVIEFGQDEATTTRAAYDGERTTKVAIPDGPPLQGELQFLLEPLKEGETAFTFYSIMSDQFQQATTKIAAQDDGHWSVSGTFSAGSYMVVLDKDARFLEGSGLMGVKLVAASEEDARNLGTADYVPPIEFGIGAKVDRPLPPPERIKSLEAVITGLELPDGLPQIEGRQTAKDTGGGYDVTVTADDIRRHKGPTLGYDVPGDLKELVRPDQFLVSDDPAVAAAAKQAAGGERDASRAAELLCAWVDRTLTFGGALDSARTAAEILSSGRGVCRDYAALYAAMARSLGIPTRICTGIVYAVDGFYLHSWAESWLGPENGWVPIDPTRSGSPVDATHITFIRGGVESVWNIMQVVRDLAIDVRKVETS